MNNENGNSEFTKWFILIKTKAPIAALGIPALSLGVFLIILSSSMKDRVSDAIYWLGVIFGSLGLIIFFVGIVTMVIKELRK